MAQLAASRGLIFWREAFRLARRRRTYWLRVALTLVLTLLVAMILVIISDDVNALTSGKAGLAVFTALSVGSVLLSSVLAPVLVIQGVQEEQDPEILSMLAITHLSPREILWSKALSRLVFLLTLLAGLLPVGAATMYLGGFDSWAVVGWAVSLFTTTVLLGSVGALLSFGSRGVVMPFVVTLGYGLWAFAFAPILLALVVGPHPWVMKAAFSLCPLLFMVEPGPWCFLPLAYVVPVLIRVYFVGGAVAIVR